MKTNEVLQRTTDVHLNNEEIYEAFKMYLHSKGVKDTEQHVVVDITNTLSEQGYVAHITLKNYNKDSNIENELKK